MSLLRSPVAVSSFSELTGSSFRPVIGDTLDPSRVRKVIFCTGKVYYDLLAARDSRHMEDIALVRIDDDVYAIDDRCSHEDYSLSEGEVLAEECEIECWKHGSTFDLRTGEPQTLPATKPVAVYPVHVEGDDVMVELP